MARKHGSLAHSGKVRGQTPKASATDGGKAGRKKVGVGRQKRAVLSARRTTNKPAESVVKIELNNGEHVEALVPASLTGVGEGVNVLLRQTRSTSASGVSLRVVSVVDEAKA
ncbi:30S ribosomal protein S30e [Streptomyces xanthochromogenes]|uniref:30S ribosomal protein S30e n=1 Tax=Streptomyces xanthochromogenes TaxID=67384 RepID=UPI00380A01BA